MKKFIITSKKKKEFNKEGMNPWLFVMAAVPRYVVQRRRSYPASIKAGKRPKEDERNRLVLSWC